MAKKKYKSLSKSIQLLGKGWRVRAKAFGYDLKNIISMEVSQVQSTREMSKVRG